MSSATRSETNMPEHTILVVEDESAIRQMLRFNLSRAGFSVQEAASTREAWERIGEAKPSLMLVDWMLPDNTGLELTRAIKKDSILQSVPIIMLTAKAQESDKIAGLDGGADDYVTKPFSPRELISRINAILRRLSSNNDEADVVTIGPLSIDRSARRVSANKSKIKLGPTEYRLLEHLMSNPDRVYSRGQLLDRVWGNDVYIEERTVDVHVRRLRKALADSGCDRLIQTVRGAGYRLSTDFD